MSFSLRAKDTSPVAMENWLQFDDLNNVFFGLPYIAAKEEYILVGFLEGKKPPFFVIFPYLFTLSLGEYDASSLWLIVLLSET